MAVEGDDIVIRGGVNSEHPDCQPSMERLNISDLNSGWKKENLAEVTENDCDALLCFDRVTVQIPCG